MPDTGADVPAPTTAAERAARRLDGELIELIRGNYPDTGSADEEEPHAYHYYAVRRIAAAPAGAPVVEAVEVMRRPVGGGPLLQEVLFLDAEAEVLTRTEVATVVSESVVRIWGTQVDLGDAEHMRRLCAGYPPPLAISAALQYAGAIVVARLRMVNEDGWESWSLPEDVEGGLRLIAIAALPMESSPELALPSPPLSYTVLPPQITDLDPRTGAIESSVGALPWEGVVRVRVQPQNGGEPVLLLISAEGRLP